MTKNALVQITSDYHYINYWYIDVNIRQERWVKSTIKCTENIYLKPNLSSSTGNFIVFNFLCFYLFMWA